MSGHKRTTITIREEEYRRLHEAEIKKRFIEKDLPKVIRELRLETQQALETNLNEAQHRQAEYQSVLEGFDEQIRVAEHRTNRAIQEQQTQLWGMVQQRAGELWDHSERLLNGLQDEFIRHMNAVQEQNQDILALQEQFDGLDDEQGRKTTTAEQWISAALDLKEFIQRNYEVDVLLPGTLDRLAPLLEMAFENLETGFPEAALISGQQAFMYCSDLRVNLEKRQSDWEILFYTVLEKAREINSIANLNREIQAIDLEGNEMEYIINVDHWSRGELSSLIRYTDDLIAQLQGRGCVFEFSILENLINDTLPELSESLEDIITRARMDVISSQIRINIADLVIEALSEQGFVPEGSSYSQGDERSSFFASVRNLEGNEVMIQVDPIEDYGNRNELHLHFLDREERTNHELRNRTTEITRSLQKHGLQIGTTSTQPEVEREYLKAFHPAQRRDRVFSEQNQT